jgi:hypothetical protein
MSRYLVKSNQNNDILTVIEWDGLSPIYSGSNYILELETTSSYSSSYFEPTVNITGSGLPLFSGEFDGIFSGELTGSITINGVDLKNVIETTEYGYLSYFSGSGSELIDTLNGIVINSSSYFAFNQTENPTEIVLLNALPSPTYSSSLSRIIDDGISNYIFKLKEFDTPSFKEYLVSDTQILSNNNIKYTVLTVNELISYTDEYYYSGSLINYGRLKNSQWHIDFDLGDKAQSGKFYGDFFGNVDITSASMDQLTVTGSINLTGSLLLDGKEIDDILSYSPKCAVIKYNTNIFFDSPPNAKEILNIPFVGNFIFNTPNISGWNATKPTIIRINANTNSRQLIYRDALFNIIKNAFQGSEMVFSYLKPGGGNYASLYKRFVIESGYYFERKFENGTPLFSILNWGSENLSTTIDFYEEFSNPNYPVRYGGDAFFHLTIREVETRNTLGYEENSYPFDMCIKANEIPRKEVFEFTTTNTDWEVPGWANKITIYSIGAGGGGGGGAAAWGHSDTLPPRDIGYGQYHTISDEIGFEWATGGGGGGGGNLSVTELIIDKTSNKINSNNIGKELIPYGSKLSIFVGSGGLGGNGLTNSDNDYILIDKQEVYYADRTNTTNPKIFWIQKILNTDDFNQTNSEMHFTENKALIGEYLYWSENLNNNWDVYPNRKIQIGNINSNGKRGGYSNVTLKAVSNPVTYTNIELVHASGGNGGLNGVALQSFFALEHRFCEKDDNVDIFKYDHTIFPTFVPGGGSDLKKSFGNKYVNLGGHGGYGRAMPILRQNMNKTHIDARYKKLNYIDFDTVLDAISGGNKNDYPDTKYNVAPYIPWDSNFPRYLTYPIGSTYELTTNESYENFGWKKYNDASYEQPKNLAPLGGNGGLGASYNVLLNYVSSEKLSELELDNIKFQRENGVPSIGIPNNWFDIISKKALDEIKWGNDYRPKINMSVNLFSLTPSRVNNEIWIGPYTFKLKSEGALGGVNIYKTVTGDTATPTSLYIPIPVPPENGLDYGQGGGGGAAAYTTDWNDRNLPISGQNGGNGANGIVIIVVE